MGAGAAFACVYAALLLRRGVPELEGALVTVSLGAAALAAGVALTARRLRRGSGLVTAVARSIGLDRLRFVQGQMNVLAAAEDAAARLVVQPGRLQRALEWYTNLFGIIIWRVFSADHTDFFVRIWSQTADGKLARYNDLPEQYWKNINTEPPFAPLAGNRPRLDAAEIDAVIAFLGTLTDGYVVRRAR